MKSRTEREFMIALTHLLDRVRVLNRSWSIDTFREASEHVANVSKSEASRFQQAMLEMNLLKQAGDKRKLTSNFDVKVYKNMDACLGLISEVLETYPDIVQKRGPKKGFKSIPTISEIVEPELINETVDVEFTLQDYSTEALFEELCSREPEAQIFVDYLRSQGWVITCAKEQTIVITL